MHELIKYDHSHRRYVGSEDPERFRVHIRRIYLNLSVYYQWIHEYHDSDSILELLLNYRTLSNISQEDL